MEVASVYEASNMISNNGFLLPNQILPLPSNWVSNSSPIFHGSASMVNFNQSQGRKGKKRSIVSQLDKEEISSNEDDYDMCFRHEKKRRLLPKQVEFLEKNFEVENKLEPERKIQLAKEIGLQPRQVAIWFQNRRARYKTKQLEKDYDILKASFDKLKTQYDCLFKQNESLRNEVLLLKEKLITRVNGKENSEAISLVDAEAQNPIGITSDLVCKQEDAKSDILDSDSPHFTDGDYTSFLEPADSSHVFETEASDFSQENDSRTLLPPLCLPKLEEHHHEDLPVNSCNFGFQMEDQSWFSHY